MNNCYYQPICSCKNCELEYIDCPRSNRVLALENSGMPSRFFTTKIVMKIVTGDALKLLEKIKTGQIAEDVNKGTNYYIWSNYAGTGKTFWSVKLGYYYIWLSNKSISSHSIYKPDSEPCLYVNVPEFYSQLQQSWKTNNAEFNKYKERILNAQLVIYDDLTAIELKDSLMNELINIINQRWANKLANITIGHCSPDELYKKVGSHIASRLVNGEVFKLTDIELRHN